MERIILFTLIFLLTFSLSCSSSFNVSTDQVHNHTVLNVSDTNYLLLREIVTMKKIESLIISNTNTSGFLPINWPNNLVLIDLSSNSIQGKIPESISTLQTLLYLNLSSNLLYGPIPDSIGDMTMLKNLSLSSNFLSGKIPESMAAMKSLVHLDLSNNRLTGDIPNFIADMKNLKYLNLAGNRFQKELPFDNSFVNRLEVFRIGMNKDLCFDQGILSPHAGDVRKLKVCYEPGPTNIIVGVGYWLMFAFVLILILVLISKWCK